MDKAVTDKKKKKELAIMVADTLQLGEAMASAAFASRKKLELGSETVRRMEKTEAIGFITEEEKERVERINKENEELEKLKQRNFFNGGGGSAPAPSRDDGAVSAERNWASAASAANSISATTHSATMGTTTASIAQFLLYQWGTQTLSLFYLPPPLARCANMAIGRSRAREPEFHVSPDGICGTTCESSGWQVEWSGQGLSAWAPGMSVESNRLVTVFTSRGAGGRNGNWYQVWDHLDGGADGRNG
jgi:hypothetical protein